MSFFRVDDQGLIFSKTGARFKLFAAENVAPTIETQPFDRTYATGANALIYGSAMNGTPVAVRQWYKRPPPAVPAPVLVQTTTVGAAEWSNATTSFPSPVTPGNTIVVFGAASDFDIATGLSSSQGDVFTVNLAEVVSGINGFIARATAVGGATSLTLGAGAAQGLVAQEWSGVAFDSAAGVGVTGGVATVVATTPNTSSVASSVTFSVFAVNSGPSYDHQVLAAGYTLIGRSTPAVNAQFIAGYRIESAVGAKSATWVDPGTGPDSRSALVAVFNSTALPVAAAWEFMTGENNRYIYTTGVTLADSGTSFYFTDTNSAGSVTSGVATLTVT